MEPYPEAQIEEGYLTAKTKLPLCSSIQELPAEPPTMSMGAGLGENSLEAVQVGQISPGQVSIPSSLHFNADLIGFELIILLPQFPRMKCLD
jgi:hypothetical protein